MTDGGHATRRNSGTKVLRQRVCQAELSSRVKVDTLGNWFAYPDMILPPIVQPADAERRGVVIEVGIWKQELCRILGHRLQLRVGLTSAGAEFNASMPVDEHVRGDPGGSRAAGWRSVWPCVADCIDDARKVLANVVDHERRVV